jgi:hypothetical protein
MLLARLLLDGRLGAPLVVFLVAAGAGAATYLALALVSERRYVLDMLAMLRPMRVAGPSA